MADLLTTQARSIDPSVFVGIQRQAFGDVLATQAAQAANDRVALQQQQQLQFDLGREMSRAIQLQIASRDQREQNNFENQIAMERATRDARSQALRDQLTIAQTRRQGQMGSGSGSSGGISIMPRADGSLEILTNATPLSPRESYQPMEGAYNPYQNRSEADQALGNGMVPRPNAVNPNPPEGADGALLPGLYGPTGPAPSGPTDDVSDFAPDGQAPVSAQPIYDQRGPMTSTVINDETKAAPVAQPAQPVTASTVTQGQPNDLESSIADVKVKLAMIDSAKVGTKGAERDGLLASEQDLRYRLAGLERQEKAVLNRVDPEIYEQYAANSPASIISQIVSDPIAKDGKSLRPMPEDNLAIAEDVLTRLNGEIAKKDSEIEYHKGLNNTGNVNELMSQKVDLIAQVNNFEIKKNQAVRALKDKEKSLSKFFTGEYNDDGTKVYDDGTPLTTQNRTEINRELKQIQEGKIQLEEALAIIDEYPEAVTLGGGIASLAQNIQAQGKGTSKVLRNLIGGKSQKIDELLDAADSGSGKFADPGYISELVEARTRLDQLDLQLTKVVGGALAEDKLSDYDAKRIGKVSLQSGSMFRDPDVIRSNIEGALQRVNYLEPIKSLHANGIPVNRINFSTMADAVERGFIMENTAFELASKFSEEPGGIISELNELYKSGNKKAALRLGEAFYGKANEISKKWVDDLRKEIESEGE